MWGPGRGGVLGPGWSLEVAGGALPEGGRAVGEGRSPGSSQKLSRMLFLGLWVGEGSETEA